MKNKRVLTLIQILALLATIILLGANKPCFAAFTLAVDPYEGGYDLRFGKIDTQQSKVVKELTITVTSDIGKQYRVYQRLDKPLTTADGIEINRNQFKMYPLINSNAKGTLERIEEFPVMSGDTLIYTSNTAGEGDTFRVVYTFEPSAQQSEGSYYGRFIFILSPVDASQDQVIKTLNMYVDLTNEGTVEISTDTGAKAIRITSSDLDRIEPENPAVSLNIKGNLGTPYRLYQKISDSLIKSGSGDLFDLTKVKFRATEANSGKVVKEGNLAELKTKSLIYASDNLGSANAIKIEYIPVDGFAQQKANEYRGAINYYMELEGTLATVDSGYIDSVDAEFNVEPIFRIIATLVTEEGKKSQEGVAFLQFGEVGYKTGTKENKVNIKIESNSEKPYLVTQKLTAPLQNEEGYEIPPESFTFKLEAKDDTQGAIKLTEENPIDAKKDVTLFVSDGSGDSDEFDIVYKLKLSSDTHGGNYNTGISYSLSEL
ncbi:MAG: hypothetical protein PHS93_05510 [Candidatus Omnitrophica bacterium]|nr:hypothetical protein [Candidatus Omnitrophota bacterium]MDD5352607.1 hypothetical protein [Candidatus Omnitrophota bacterium]MDD5550205.1 hypothetical protein [Candidatus Omnitrophota bacterium]